jgi:hypothetical protein
MNAAADITPTYGRVLQLIQAVEGVRTRCSWTTAVCHLNNFQIYITGK